MNWIEAIAGIVGRIVIGLFGLSGAVAFGWGAWSTLQSPAHTLGDRMVQWGLAEVLGSAALFFGAMAAVMTVNTDATRRIAIESGRLVMIVWGGTLLIFILFLVLAVMKPTWEPTLMELPRRYWYVLVFVGIEIGWFRYIRARAQGVTAEPTSPSLAERIYLLYHAPVFIPIVMLLRRKAIAGWLLMVLTPTLYSLLTWATIRFTR